MVNSLVDAVSPYLRSHSDNPVQWRAWGADAFEAAARRDVPVLVSIGYSTCHWCHVMARESFSDPELAAQINANFVAIKVDREEHPDVDSSYLSAAGAFTGQLGWPLNVFVTPQGKAFYAGTYWPPRPAPGHPAFRQVLDAVIDAWQNRREEVLSNATTVAATLAERARPTAGALPTDEAWTRIVAELVEHEDLQFGGFGGAPKFPVAPVVTFLQHRGSIGAPESADSAALATRTLTAMAASALRDRVEGGFFRYSTMRDWTDPHYERMLYDNAILLGAYSRMPGGLPIAEGVAGFLSAVLRVPGGAFASAQDSESTVAGQRVEGGYYRLDAAARAVETPPALDEKVLTGWNGLAIEALADAGARHGRADWVDLATGAADYLLARHLLPDGTLVRASIGDRISNAKATLEDYGMFASALTRLAIATGEVSYAVVARDLVDAALSADAAAGLGANDLSSSDRPLADAALEFRAPGGGDPVLEAQGLMLEVDPSEGAYPSGLSAMASAAHTLYLLTSDARYLRAAMASMELFSPLAQGRPVSFGAALGVMTRLQGGSVQLVVVSDAGTDAAGPPASLFPSVASVARGFDAAGSLAVVVTSDQARGFAAAGFELFAGRVTAAGESTAYLCRDFTCLLPATTAAELERQLADTRP